MKLKIKHLAPYLPYGLWIKHPLGYHYSGNTLIDCVYLTMSGLNDNYIGFNEVPAFYPIEHFKPILHPLSDLTKVCTKEGEPKMNTLELVFGSLYRRSLVGGQSTGQIHAWNRSPIMWKWYETQLLFKKHFDVFGLIDKGLAIDINTLT